MSERMRGMNITHCIKIRQHKPVSRLETKSPIGYVRKRSAELLSEVGILVSGFMTCNIHSVVILFVLMTLTLP